MTSSDSERMIPTRLRDRIDDERQALRRALALLTCARVALRNSEHDDEPALHGYAEVIDVASGMIEDAVHRLSSVNLSHAMQRRESTPSDQAG